MGADWDLRRAELSDGSFFLFRLCYLSPPLASEGIFDAGGIDAPEGFELSQSEEEGIRFASDCFGAEKAALQLIARAEQNAFGLRRKLEKRGHGSACAGAVTARLCELGLLDDCRYARLWLESRVGRQASSPSRLRAALRAKGIDKEDAESALREALDDEAELRLLERFARKWQRKRGAKGGEEDADDFRRSLKYLLKSEGFSYAAIEGFFGD